MTGIVSYCNPTQQSCLSPEEELFSHEAPVCSVPPAGDSSSVAVAPTLDKTGNCTSVSYFSHPRNWFDVDIQTLQKGALCHYQKAYENEIENFTHYWTQPGTAYAVLDNLNTLPLPVRAYLDQTGIRPQEAEGLVFVWTWRGGRPDIVFFRPQDQAGQRQLALAVNRDDGAVYVLEKPDPHNFPSWDPREVSEWELPSLSFSSEFGLEPIQGSQAASEGSDTSGAMMLGGTLYRLGSLLNRTPGNIPGNVEPGLPVGSALIGTGLLVGIHYGVLELGVSERLASFVSVPTMIGTLEVINEGSAFLARQNLLNRPFFPNGINYAGMAKATPFMVVGSIGTGFLLDTVVPGCEFGSTCNTVGAIGITTFGYVGFGHMARTSKAFMGLRDAYAYATAGTLSNGARALAPKVINIGSRALTLSAPGALEAGGVGGGIYVAGGGIAGGAGVLGGILQAAGAIGAVSLGSWVGGGIVDLWAWLSDNNDDPNYQLVSMTWDYINRDLGFLYALLGPVVRGIEATIDAFTDDIAEKMESLWREWTDDCNRWGDGMKELLLALVLASTVRDDSDPDSPKFTFNREIFRRGVRDFYRTNKRRLESFYRLLGILRPSGKAYRFNRDTVQVHTHIGKNGSVRGWGTLPDYLRSIVREAQEEGRLSSMFRRLIRPVRRQWAQRMVDVGLAIHEREVVQRIVDLGIARRDETLDGLGITHEGIDYLNLETDVEFPDGSEQREFIERIGGSETLLKIFGPDNVLDPDEHERIDSYGRIFPLYVAPHDLNIEQIIFLYGGSDTYLAVVNGKITDPSQIQSEHVEYKRALDHYEELYRSVDPRTDADQLNLGETLFPSGRAKPLRIRVPLDSEPVGAKASDQDFVVMEIPLSAF